MRAIEFERRSAMNIIINQRGMAKTSLLQPDCLAASTSAEFKGGEGHLI